MFHSFSSELFAIRDHLSDYMITVNARNPETGSGFAHLLIFSTWPGIELVYPTKICGINE